MDHMILGLFTDFKQAGQAVSELKEKGYTKDISVMAQDEKHVAPNITEVKQDVSEGATAGAVAGGAIGVLAGLLVGITSVTIPGIGIVYGPLATAFSAAGGAAAGAVTGGIVGALVDLGIPEATAQLYKERIEKGEVLVAVSTTPKTIDEVRSILEKHNALEINEVTKKSTTII